MPSAEGVGPGAAVDRSTASAALVDARRVRDDVRRDGGPISVEETADEPKPLANGVAHDALHGWELLRRGRQPVPCPH